MPTTTNHYDSNGRLDSTQTSAGTTTYSYDARGQLQTVTAPGSSVTTFEYDANGNLETLTDPTNGVTSFGFDAAGHLTSVKDPNGNTRSMEVDAAGRVKASIDALGHRTEYGYDEAGNRTSLKDAQGHVTGFSYDALDRLRSTTDAENHTTRTTYDAAGRVVAQTDANGHTTKTQYDVAGRVVGVDLPDGTARTMGYCADVGGSGGEPCAEMDALGNVTTRQFDSNGRVTSTTDPLGRVSRQTYDHAGRVKSSDGPGQEPTGYVYDSMGRLSSITTGGLTVSYDYDGRGNRLHVYAKNANGTSETTTYTYDGANHLLTETNPIGKKTTYTYDAAGNRQTKVDANGHLTTYVYDANRRLKEVDFDDGTSYQYDYDELGRRTLEKDHAEERHLQYDALGRLEEVNDVTQGRTLTYGYDANGNRTSFSDGVLTYGYQYDALNRLKVALQADGGRILFSYDVDGRRSSVERPNGVATSYSYDAAGQVTTISHAKAGIVLAAFGYTYDEHGNRTTKSREDGTKESYGYDTRNRLTSVTYGNGRTMNYTLDDWGNRLKQSGIGPDWTSSYNLFNQRTSAYSTGVPAINETDTYDANGSLKNEAAVQNGATTNTTYTWDRDSRLTQVTLLSGLMNTFAYDANGLRVKKVDSSGASNFVLDGSSVVDELDNAGNVRTSYLNHPQAIDQVLTFQQGGQTYYPLTDALGSVYVIADSRGQVVRTNSYEVYGARTSNGTGPQMSFGFTGREQDIDTGLNYNRDRYLNPATGAWLQADRLEMKADGPNFYAYGREDPVRHRDPSGRSSLFGAILGDIEFVQLVLENRNALHAPIDGLVNKIPWPPEAESLSENIDSVSGVFGQIRWFQNVWPAGDWDWAHYLHGERLDRPELNRAVQLNASATGASAGISRMEVHLLGDAGQLVDDTLGDTGSGHWDFNAPLFPYADDPDDAFWIDIGYAYYLIHYVPCSSGRR